MKPYDSVEIRKCAMYLEDNLSGTYFKTVEAKNPGAIDYVWSIYLQRKGISECIADCPTQEVAEWLRSKLI